MSLFLRYPTAIEEGITKIESLLSKNKVIMSMTVNSSVSRRSLALLLLQKEPIFWKKIQQQEPYIVEIESVIQSVQSQFSDPLILVIAKTRHQMARKIEESAVVKLKKKSPEGEDFFHQLTVNPITGFPLLIFVLYFGIYKFVGEFGAGILVNQIEGFFANNINPVVNQITAQFLPWKIAQDLIANDYGIITLGVRYAIAIIFPIVTTFFLVLSLLEDSGYLPRISLLVDRLFKPLGLSGRAIIPLILGLGCGTMATLVTRTLESKRERFIATLLLALVIPCSAQLGIILGLLSQNPLALTIWLGCLGIVFLGVGILTAKVIPGNMSSFYMEIPPLRWPHPMGIVSKTYGRVKWYIKEITGLFILASIFIWIGKLTGIFELLVNLLNPIMIDLGLPKDAASVFLYGFFRRDYGAAGMFDLYNSGILDGRQLVVTAVTLTLFIPCIAQFQSLLREQGLKTTLGMTSFILTFAFCIGYSLNQLLLIFEVSF
ncbi:nucleoside recognition domain-containing protein [Aphanothece sacrum]|uniref:Fe2+ transport system protein B n=1 Tax=Aphanothece sacrum FPU1 TaxID=1920663 RepID=A0A401ICY1_APHSA|nr:ferrous iron transporter B [Aphanothece sacrum]GBF79039.1 Fe2+ transport system protein B [Aphanothece sacrum FPU1]GBF86082.1 Fe2+ transport system protein B [Aphanothece sacrum FPU3]